MRLVSISAVVLLFLCAAGELQAQYWIPAPYLYRQPTYSQRKNAERRAQQAEQNRLPQVRAAQARAAEREAWEKQNPELARQQRIETALRGQQNMIMQMQMDQENQRNQLQTDRMMKQADPPHYVPDGRGGYRERGGTGRITPDGRSGFRVSP